MGHTEFEERIQVLGREAAIAVVVYQKIFDVGVLVVLYGSIHLEVINHKEAIAFVEELTESKV